MQHFQPILIAIGVLAIVGVLIHGFLLNRKNKLSLTVDQEEDASSTKEPDESNIDSTNIFTRSSKANKSDSISRTAKTKSLHRKSNSDVKAVDQTSGNTHKSAHTVSEKPEKSTDKTSDGHKKSINQTSEHNENSVTKSTKTQTKSEASIPESETVIDKVPTEHNKEPNQPSKIKKVSRKEEPKTVNKESPVDIFIFNVVKRDDSLLGGHALLQFFLTSGFRYGDMNIFHRHENSDGTGEVLFSIANMMAPGTFDLDSMEQFNSQGISFFLTAPNSKISIKTSFDLMLRAVVQIAEEFDCDVLNEQREALTEKQFIGYRNRLQQYP